MQLKPGELWKKSLYKHIDNCDVFFLFWSSSAKSSKWVMEEYKYAQSLQSKGNAIEIIPTLRFSAYPRRFQMHHPQLMRKQVTANSTLRALCGLRG